jgi:hypothetical protein
MAKKDKLDARLNAGVQSWESQIEQSLGTQPEETRQVEYPDKVKRKTFLVTQMLIDRINEMAETHGVGQNELVRHLLIWSLDQIDAGKHQIPLGTPRYTIEA